MILISLAVFYVAGLYEKQTRPIRSVMGIRILGAQVATVAIAAILFFILPLSIAPKTILVLYLIVSVAAESLWRFYRMNREMGEANRVPALLVGTGTAVLELYDEVRGNDRYMIRFAAHQDTKDLHEGAVFNAVTASVKSGVRMIVIDISDPVVANDLSQLYELMTDDVTFLEFASLYEEIFDRVPLEHLDAAQLLESLSEHRSIYDASKRVFDIVLALIGSIFAIPFIAIAAFALLVTRRHAVYF